MPDSNAPDQRQRRGVSRLFRGAVLTGLLATLVAAPGHAEQPMSAIDWLSPSVAPPAQPGLPTRQVPPPAWRPGTPAPPPPRPAEAPVATTGAVGPVTTLRLGEANPETIGLIPAAQAGLPDDLWQASRAEDAAALIATVPTDGPPAIGALLRQLLIARLRPIPGAQGALFLARVDRLLDLGAVDAAQALLEAAGPGDPDRFRRIFDVALLTGHEHRACEVVQSAPGIAPSLPVRIFCLARNGDWSAAMTSYAAARDLGLLPPDIADLILRFLEPEAVEDDQPTVLNDKPTPLSYRMLEAIGEPMATQGLPLAFAQADLSANTGWRAQIEAAERLARVGSLRADRLFEIYGDQKAAASGGVWDRVAAMAALEDAVAGGDAAVIGPALITAWDRMAADGLLGPLADAYAPRLLPLADQLDPAAGGRAALLGLMTRAAGDWAATTPGAALPPLLRALATDAPLADPGGADLLGSAIATGFASDAAPSTVVADLLAKGRKGEALCLALTDLAEGAHGGEPRRVTAGLAALRALSLEPDARLIARQALILHAARQ